MRFGKIDYLNLLPFEVFMRKYPAPSYCKLFYNKKKSYPAKLNIEFLFNRIDAGFISSITAMRAQNERFRVFDVGICAKKEVKSVICIKDDLGNDYQSATSNALLKVLGLQGRVLIGDRALRYVLDSSTNKQDYIDMCLFWVEKERIPFVFGRLCARKHKEFFCKVALLFAKSHVKIPHYIIDEYSKKSGVSKEDILEYLNLLTYKIDKKTKIGLYRFYRKARILGVKSPKRF
ncbi:MqnA/MqnD/SBP family protein [Helicobacter ibis]|uniref:Chorismate dehydratase n=1 Tax=Helicobacter ibis TaxID=2962633 RepID=A0ABT4VFK6_9HELI|nr:MqnA/MqnD/SBP family protein [Helicobacter ibis]MDA3969479.1 menaquinone biosynthesis protein [Helicobacter ibis]